MVMEQSRSLRFSPLHLYPPRLTQVFTIDIISLAPLQHVALSHTRLHKFWLSQSSICLMLGTYRALSTQDFVQNGLLRCWPRLRRRPDIRTRDPCTTAAGFPINPGSEPLGVAFNPSGEPDHHLSGAPLAPLRLCDHFPPAATSEELKRLPSSRNQAVR